MMSRKLKFTDKFIKSAKPQDGKQTEYFDTHFSGLCLRVNMAGSKTWTMRYRVKGGDAKQKRLTIGTYPEMKLAEAGELTVKYRGQAKNGNDPALKRKAKLEKKRLKREKIALKDRDTVQAIGEWYYKECKAGRQNQRAKRPKRESTLITERLYFDKTIVPALGKLKLADIPRATIEQFINDLTDNRSKGAGRHCYVILHSLYEFAIWKEITDRNPCRGLSKPQINQRKRVLTNTELKTVWKVFSLPIDTPKLSVSPNVACAILLAMVTLQRRGEVAQMNINELNFEDKLWIIPGNRAKNHHEHAVPLSNLAIELIELAMSLRIRQSSFIFPSPQANETHDIPINPKAVTRAFARMRVALNLSDVIPHDLRRTGATNLTSERLGFPRFIVSRVLNQMGDTGGAAAVTGVYDRNEYLSEKRRALDAWSIRLLEIVEGKEAASNVVPITG